MYRNVISLYWLSAVTLKSTKGRHIQNSFSIHLYKNYARYIFCHFKNGIKWEKCKTEAFSQIGFWSPLYCVWNHLQWRLELLVVGIFKALATEPCNLSASTALAPSQITFSTRLVSNQSSGKRVTVSNEIAIKYCLDAGWKPKSHRPALL